jgi:superfamily II DNA or RNA helicase
MQIKLRPHQERGDVAMQQHNLGQLIYPTGGGKTLNMIMDAVRQFQSATPQTSCCCCSAHSASRAVVQ